MLRKKNLELQMLLKGNADVALMKDLKGKADGTVVKEVLMDYSNVWQNI